VTDTAKRYGESFYGLALEEELDTTILSQLRSIQDIFSQEPNYLRLLASPKLSKKEKGRLLTEAFEGKVHLYTLNFLRILSDQGLLSEFNGCVEAFRNAYNEQHGILEVTVTSAVALDDSKKQKLLERICDMTGKTVDLKERVNPSIIGGIRLEMDGKRFDGTVQRRLENLRGDILEARDELQ